MATALITLTTAGADTDSFSLSSDTSGFATNFESGISRASLLAGYTSNLVPPGTTTIRVKSNSVGCSNFVDIVVGGLTTTSTTTTTTSLPVNSRIYNLTSTGTKSVRFNVYCKVGIGGTYQLVYAEPNVITLLESEYYEFYQSIYPAAFGTTSNVYFRLDILAGSSGIQKKSLPPSPSDTAFTVDKFTGSFYTTTNPVYFSADSPLATTAQGAFSGAAPNTIPSVILYLTDFL